jgi:hypothetical protein
MFLLPYHDVRGDFEQDVTKKKYGQSHVELSTGQLKVVLETCNPSIANIGAIQETEEVQKRPDRDETVVKFALEVADGKAVRVEFCNLANVFLLMDISVLSLF